MTLRPKRPCRQGLCRATTRDKSGYCEDHRVRWRSGPKPSRPVESAHERGYTRSWAKASRSFLAEHPWCVACGRPAAVTDHITPHRQDADLFWDAENWQPLCKACHAQKTARGE